MRNENARISMLNSHAWYLSNIYVFSHKMITYINTKSAWIFAVASGLYLMLKGIWDRIAALASKAFAKAQFPKASFRDLNFDATTALLEEDDFELKASLFLLKACTKISRLNLRI